jgi:hypothetical protein
MIIDEEDHVEIINSYPKEKWQILFDLIPDIEQSDGFGESKSGELSEDGSRQLPYYEWSKIVDRFFDIVHNEVPIVISFDWPDWNKGIEILHKNSFDYDSLDIATNCKLVTTLIRADRFSDGVLVEAFESGQVLGILKSIEKQVNQKIS